MSDADHLRAAVQRFSRGVGLLRDDVTPCGVDLPVVQAHALLALLGEPAARGLRVSDLYAHLQLDLSNVSRLVARMEQAGLVARNPCPDDARAVRVVLTPEGRTLAERVDRRSRARFARVLEAIEISERPGVLAALQTLNEAIDLANLSED